MTRNRHFSLFPLALCLATLGLPLSVMAQDHSGHSTADQPGHVETQVDHMNELPPPQLPEGQTLDQVLQYAADLPIKHVNSMMGDDVLRAYFMFDQLEYRFAAPGQDQLGWDAFGWLGYDKDRLWVKSEGEAGFEGSDRGESENDVLYSRLLTPFWMGQVGFQYANDWQAGRYHDRWSAAASVMGDLPFNIDTDLSVYLSDKADLTAKLEMEYDLLITQRLVLSPRMELTFAAQDVPERHLGAGLAQGDFDLRLRYEFTRKFAPYIGVRYHLLVGESRGMARNAGEPAQQVMWLTGVRLSF
jgi:copper resistance protein B